MMDFEDFGNPIAGKPLSQADKAAAVLLAMGKGVAGKLRRCGRSSDSKAVLRLPGSFWNCRSMRFACNWLVWPCKASP